MHLRTTTDRQDAQMTLAVIAYEHNVPYNTVNTASELMEYLDVPPDVFLIDIDGKDPAIELTYEFVDDRFLSFSVREKSINIIDYMGPAKPNHKYRATYQDCIDVYKKYADLIQTQFSFYEESF